MVLQLQPPAKVKVTNPDDALGADETADGGNVVIGRNVADAPSRNAASNGATENIAISATDG